MKTVFNSIVLVALATMVQADFSEKFRDHFSNLPELLKDLSRKSQLGPAGSFGGGNHVGGAVTKKIPIIIVHAGASNAGSFEKYRDHFIKQGYSNETVYATSWGFPTETIQQSLEMKCEYVKRIRKLFFLVASFTGGKVDIVAYGEGAPIARKAVIGGNCVDTNQDTGDSLRNEVRAFVSVRGQNGGILCDPSGDKRATCLNMDIGLNCGSKFIKDINAIGKHWKEAVHSIHSIVPLLLQKTSCGSDPYTIPYSKVYEYDFNGVEQNVNRVVEILKKL